MPYLEEPTKCPRCCVCVHGAADVLEGQTARPGDFAMCIECRAINMFDDGLKLVIPSDEDRAKIANVNPEIEVVRMALGMFKPAHRN
jgi:hypothetical protein